MIEWTVEEIAKLTDEKVKSLRENAENRGRKDIVDRCEAELRRRKPIIVKAPRPESADETRAGQYVSEFHFVCPKELGVTKNQDGTIWTGTWVVAANNAKNGEKYGALVALHTSKAEPSYLQGVIKGWRKSPRELKYSEDQTVKTEFGIDFRFEPSNAPAEWKGEGAGEKGYAWIPIP